MESSSQQCCSRIATCKNPHVWTKHELCLCDRCWFLKHIYWDEDDNTNTSLDSSVISKRPGHYETVKNRIDIIQYLIRDIKDLLKNDEFFLYHNNSYFDEIEPFEKKLDAIKENFEIHK